MWMDKKLRIEKDKHLNRMNQIMDSTPGDLTGAQRAEFDKLDAKVSALNVEIAAVEARRAEARASGDFVRVPDPDSEAGRPLRFSAPGRAKYADLFPEAKSSDGFGSFEEYLTTMHTGMSDPRLRAGMTEGVGSEGGFFVPSEYASALLDAALEGELVRPRARVFPMQSERLKISGFDFSDNSGNSPAGFAGQWLAEAGTASNSTGKVRRIELVAKKLAVFAMASNELADDGLLFESQLGDAMTRSLSWNLDRAFFNGTGAGQPLGYLNSSSVIEVAKETSQVAATINYANLRKMVARLHPASWARAEWFIHPAAIPELLNLSHVIRNQADSENVGGSHIPVLSESNGQLRILTRPVNVTEKAENRGTKGDISLIDWSQYAIGLRRQVVLQKSAHVGWQSDESGYRTILRVDGMPTWGAAFTPRVGSTLSWAVVLQTRS